MHVAVVSPVSMVVDSMLDRPKSLKCRRRVTLNKLSGPHAERRRQTDRQADCIQ